MSKLNNKAKATKNIVLSISGMHCRSCEALIRDSLMELGIDSCEIDHNSGKATIIFDESKIGLDTIKAMIKKQGYGVV